MHLQFWTIIPSLAAIFWALTVKFKEKQLFEAITLLVCAIALAINGISMYCIIYSGGAPAFLRPLQQLFSSSIVPLAYMYFSRQMGRKWNNTTAIFCWAMMLLVFIPNINIVLGDDSLLDTSFIQPSSFNIISGGTVAMSLHIADIVILIQALLTVGRMIPAARTLHQYGLKLSPKMKGFYLWWAAAVAFIAFTSVITVEDLRTPLGGWSYYLLYSLLIISIYSMLALRFDLHPVVTRDEGEAVHVDAFIDASKSMAARLRVLVENDRIYLQQGYGVEDAAAALGTNRTYLSRMMTAEFGMKFSDLMNEYRVARAKELLATTDMSIAEVAYDSGFSDASYMNKKFHQIVGDTPSAFRAAQHGTTDSK